MRSLVCTSSVDKTVKIYDVVNFDMINILKPNMTPGCTCWIYSAGDIILCKPVTDADSPTIKIYDGRGTNTPLRVLEKLHTEPVTVITDNARFETSS
jgi:peptidylprolyl isomerase domain and WD repeat-containing protein 1